MKIEYTSSRLGTFIYVDRALWGKAVMTGKRFEWEVYQWVDDDFKLVATIRGIGSFDNILGDLLRTRKERS